MKFLKTLMNLGKIKEYAKVVLSVVVKAGNILEAVEKELADTSIVDKLGDVLPKVKDALATVRDSLSKVLDFFGEDVTEEVTSLSDTSLEVELAELEEAVTKLKNL